MMMAGLVGEQEWKGLQYEHVDWNDIIEAEMSGKPEALRLLRLAILLRGR